MLRLGQEKSLSTIWMPHELEAIHSFAVIFKKMCSQCVLTNTLGFLVTDPWFECNSTRGKIGTKKDVFLFPKYNKGKKKKVKKLISLSWKCQNPMVHLHISFSPCFSFTPTCLNCTCAYVIHQWNSLWSPTICAFFFLHCIKP